MRKDMTQINRQISMIITKKNQNIFQNRYHDLYSFKYSEIKGVD